jgi:hypothetical protein
VTSAPAGRLVPRPPSLASRVLLAATPLRPPRTSPTRESDRLLRRIKTLVQDTRCDKEATVIELEAQRREIERLKTQLAEIVKRAAAANWERP